MADAARAAAKPTAAVQRETAASKKPAAPSPVVAPAVNGANGLLYSAGPAMTLGLGVQCKVVVGPPDDPFEREADAVAQRVTAGGPAMPVLRLARGEGGWGLGTGGWGLGGREWGVGGGERNGGSAGWQMRG